MKALLLFLSVSILACNTGKKDRFINYLGINYSRSLDYSVEKLDNLIFSYSTEENLNEAYSKFLADFYRGKDSLKEYLKNNKKIFEDVEYEFKRSGIYYELFYLIKSYSISNNFIDVKYFIYDSLRHDEELEYTYGIPEINDSTEIKNALERIYNRKFLIHPNVFISALDDLNFKNKVLLEYLKVRKESLTPNLLILDNIFLSKNINYNNYFIKRILAVELLLFNYPDYFGELL